MNESVLAEIINAQADALNRGEDIEPDLLAQYPELKPEEIKHAVTMFQLARRLKSALTPMAPAASFRKKLLDDLTKQGTAEIYVRPPAYKPGMAWLWVAAAGSLVSFFGVIVLLLRRLRNGGRRDAQPLTTTI